MPPLSWLHRLSPRPLLAVRGLERRDPVAMAFRHIDVVPAVEQLIAAHRIDSERKAAVAARDCLLLKIDGDRQFRIGSNRGAELDYIRFGKNGGQESVLDGVLCEDVAERRGDHAADASPVKRENGRFAPAPAA